MGILTFLLCSVTTVVILLAVEILALLLIMQIPAIRGLLWDKVLRFRYALLIAICIQLVVFVHLSCIAGDVEEVKPTRAQAQLFPKGVASFIGETPLGVIDFEEFKTADGKYQITIRGRITHIFPANSLHGFHIHDVANYSTGCDSTGGHYNPLKTDHGDMINHEAKRHVGDLGNVPADGFGLVNVDLTDSIIRLSGNSIHNIIGRPLVIHEGEDDLGTGESASSKVNGNAGKRLACGTVIRD